MFWNLKTCSKQFEQFLSENEQPIFGKGMRIGFSKCVTVSRLTELFTEYKSLGMLEEAHYNIIYVVSPIFGEVVDSSCGQTTSVPVKKVFTLFIDLKIVSKSIFAVQQGLERSSLRLTNRSVILETYPFKFLDDIKRQL